MVLDLAFKLLPLPVLAQFKIQRPLAYSDSLSADSWFPGDIWVLEEGISRKAETPLMLDRCSLG